MGTNKGGAKGVGRRSFLREGGAFRLSLLSSALVALFGASSLQAATPASSLGAELTPFGAEKAGNSSGTIPAWDGGLTKAPAGWKPGHGDPYGADKPLYSIDASNLAQHEAELPPGQAALVKTYPGYRLDVYPTHRSCTFPSEIARRTREFAGQSRIASNGWQLEQAAGASIPFPVPQSGLEVMWNYKLRYMGKGRRAQVSLLIREKGGALSEFKQWIYEYYPYNDPAVKTPADTGGYDSKLLSDVLSPSSRAGEMYLVHSYLDKPQDSWIYFPRPAPRAPGSVLRL
ncbi:DUF1329 domain-containing protein [Pseudomonas sp. NY15181]|uniref:DUF1329 domain-containing protein n=1 Tax=Pseudomonas sp. NY15181 TaxID=3400349 RepID=UPI003A8ABA81